MRDAWERATVEKMIEDSERGWTWEEACNAVWEIMERGRRKSGSGPVSGHVSAPSSSPPLDPNSPSLVSSENMSPFPQVPMNRCPEREESIPPFPSLHHQPEPEGEVPPPSQYRSLERDKEVPHWLLHRQRNVLTEDSDSDELSSSSENDRLTAAQLFSKMVRKRRERMGRKQQQQKSKQRGHDQKQLEQEQKQLVREQKQLVQERKQQERERKKESIKQRHEASKRRTVDEHWNEDDVILSSKSDRHPDLELAASIDRVPAPGQAAKSGRLPALKTAPKITGGRDQGKESKQPQLQPEIQRQPTIRRSKTVKRIRQEEPEQPGEPDGVENFISCKPRKKRRTRKKTWGDRTWKG
jgi:hypothetical protein